MPHASKRQSPSLTIQTRLLRLILSSSIFLLAACDEEAEGGTPDETGETKAVASVAVPAAPVDEDGDQIYGLVITEARQSTAGDLICNERLVGEPLVKGQVSYRNVDLHFDEGDQSYAWISASYDHKDDDLFAFQLITGIPFHDLAGPNYDILDGKWREYNFQPSSRGESKLRVRVEGTTSEGTIHFESCMAGRGGYERYVNANPKRYEVEVSISQARPELHARIERTFDAPIDWGGPYECTFDEEKLSQFSADNLLELLVEMPGCGEAVKAVACPQIARMIDRRLTEAYEVAVLPAVAGMAAPAVLPFLEWAGLTFIAAAGINAIIDTEPDMRALANSMSKDDVEKACALCGVTLPDAAPAPLGPNCDPNSREETPSTHPDQFRPVRGTPAKIHVKTGEVWDPDRLHHNHWEVYKKKSFFDKGTRDRSVWQNGCFKERF